MLSCTRYLEQHTNCIYNSTIYIRIYIDVKVTYVGVTVLCSYVYVCTFRNFILTQSCSDQRKRGRVGGGGNSTLLMTEKGVLFIEIGCYVYI